MVVDIAGASWKERYGIITKASFNGYCYCSTSFPIVLSLCSWLNHKRRNLDTTFKVQHQSQRIFQYRYSEPICTLIVQKQSRQPKTNHIIYLRYTRTHLVNSPINKVLCFFLFFFVFCFLKISFEQYFGWILNCKIFFVTHAIRHWDLIV